jgi:hypothetical protein
MLKTCTKCGQEKPASVDNFFRHPQGSASRLCGWLQPCKACIKISAAKRHKATWKSEYALRLYGMTEADYQFLLRIQNNACALCGCDAATYQKKGKPARFHVDHDHSHHRLNRRKGCRECIRGLLCDFCNHSFLFWCELHPHLQNDRVRAYLQNRPLLLILNH